MTSLLHASRCEIKPGKKVVLDDYDPMTRQVLRARIRMRRKNPRNSTRN